MVDKSEKFNWLVRVGYFSRAILYFVLMIPVTFLTGEEIAIEFSKLLPGEKLHESLYSVDEELVDTPHPKIKRIHRTGIQETEWNKLLSELQGNPEQDDAWALQFLKKYVSSFRSE